MVHSRKFLGIGFWLGLTLVMAGLMGCEAKIDREFKKVAPYMNHVKQLHWDSLPDSAATVMMKFVKDFPEHPEAGPMTIASFRIAERKNWVFKASEWSQYYLDTYKPKGQGYWEMLVISSHFHEQAGMYQKAIANYRLLKSEVDSGRLAGKDYADIYKQALIVLEMLEKGLVTPEQQAEYIIKQAIAADSTSLVPTSVNP
ncbi:MAG: hypothetical protein ACK448_02820 [Bacteroidota bacterium]